MTPNAADEQRPTRDDAEEAEKACGVGRPLQWLVRRGIVRTAQPFSHH